MFFFHILLVESLLSGLLCECVLQAAVSDHRGDSPVKTIPLCDKATLIPLCETCNTGPPTVCVCVTENEYVCFCVHVVSSHRMCPYVYVVVCVRV